MSYMEKRWEKEETSDANRQESKWNKGVIQRGKAVEIRNKREVTRPGIERDNEGVGKNRLEHREVEGKEYYEDARKAEVNREPRLRQTKMTIT